jgi:hypothetical protein
VSNLARTQADWTKLFKEFAVFLAPSKELEDAIRKYDLKRNRTQLRETYERPAALVWNSLTGVKIGVNTDEDGILYVRITDESPGAGQATVDVYKAAGGGAGNKVATGSAADLGTITLAQANSSGISGSVTIPTVTASESDDKRRLRVFQDWPLRANTLLDGTETEHQDERAAFNGMCVLVQRKLLEAKDIVKAALRQFALGRLANFQKSGQASLMTATTPEDQGAIASLFIGILEDARKNMVDEATGGAQTVKKSSASAGAGVFDAQNQGKGAMGAPSVREWVADGVVTFTCIDATVGSERFEAVQKVTTTGEVRRARNPLQVKRTWSDPDLGIDTALLTRTLNLDAGVANDFATAADFTITGEVPGNTDEGTLYLKIVAGTIDPTKWKIQFFRSSARTNETMVGESNEAAAAATGVGINSKNTSGLSGTCKIGAAPTANNTGALNLQTFRTQGATSKVADKFTVTVTVTAKGEIQDQLDALAKYALNSTSGGPTISDSYVTAGTFPPYEKRDA